MEGELRDIQSASFTKKSIQDVLQTLSETITQAADARDMDLVNDPELRRALNIVEDFLRNSRRICYGGMAINAHLPKERKFYDFQKTLPDYDFFTPNPEQDVRTLVQTFKRAGFSEVSARVGMHEGTTKLFINYTGVADITGIPQWLYNMLLKRSIQDDGIQYADADFLRMNMYLELSRPRGEVERWDKVYKRLLLLNFAKQPTVKYCGKKRTGMIRLDTETREGLLDYVIEKGLVFTGSELQKIYSKPSQKQFAFIKHSQSPLVLLVENPAYHIPVLRQILHNRGHSVSIVHWPDRGNILPELYGIKKDGKLAVVLISEQGCNAYNTIQLPGKRQLKIAALDTAITTYYMLTFIKGLEGLVPKSTHCFAEHLVDISMRTRDHGDAGQFSLFVETCEGHQPSKASLLREKHARVKLMKTRRRSHSSKRPSHTKKHRR
jgi:hypothetical protein